MRGLWPQPDTLCPLAYEYEGTSHFQIRHCSAKIVTLEVNLQQQGEVP